MSDWSVTKEHNPARGAYWVVRRKGVRVGSASTEASAKRLMRECQKESEGRS